MEVKKEIENEENLQHSKNKWWDQDPSDKVADKKSETKGGEDDIDAIDDPSILREKIKQLKEEQEKIKSDNQRWVQLILRDKRNAEEYIQNFKKAVREVRDDKSSLVQWHKEDPKIAKDILEQYFDWISISEFIKEELDWVIPEDKFDPEKEKEKIRKEVQEEENKAKSERLLNKYLKEVDEELHDQIREEFNGIVGNRSLSTELVKKYFKVALSIVSPVTKPPKSAEVVKDQAQKQWAPATKTNDKPGASRVKDFIAKKNKAEGRVKSDT